MRVVQGNTRGTRNTVLMEPRHPPASLRDLFLLRPDVVYEEFRIEIPVMAWSRRSGTF